MAQLFRAIFNLLRVDSISQLTPSAGVSIEDILILNDVAVDSGSATKQLFLDSSNNVVYQTATSSADTAEFIEDFSLLYTLPNNPNVSTMYIVADKPWLCRSDNVDILDYLIGFGSNSVNSANPYNDMVGCVYIRYLNAQSGVSWFGLSNGFSMSPSFGAIECTWRLNIRYLSDPSFSTQELYFGLGQNSIVSNDFDLNGQVAFAKIAGTAQWCVYYGNTGLPSIMATSIVADEFTHSFKITISGTSPNFTVNWYIDGTSVYSTTVTSLQRLSPRLLYNFNGTGISPPVSDGIGVVLDLCRCTYEYPR